MTGCDSYNIMDAIRSLERDNDRQSMTLFLHSDILDNYDDFKNRFFRRIEEDGMILINGRENNPSYISFMYKQKYYSLYAVRERYPSQVMILCKFLNVNDLRHSRVNQ
jgi:hypothetical protein